MNRGFLFTAIRSAFVAGKISSHAYSKLVKMAMCGVDLEAVYDNLLKEIHKE